MASPLARIGDPSDHGGYIMSVSTTRTYCDGKLIARVGDMHSCPIPGHGVTPIVSAPGSILSVEGAVAAVVGSKAGCGATISAGSPVASS